MSDLYIFLLITPIGLVRLVGIAYRNAAQRNRPPPVSCHLPLSVFQGMRYGSHIATPARENGPTNLVWSGFLGSARQVHGLTRQIAGCRRHRRPTRGRSIRLLYLYCPGSNPRSAPSHWAKGALGGFAQTG